MVPAVVVPMEVVAHTTPIVVDMATSVVASTAASVVRVADVSGVTTVVVVATAKGVVAHGSRTRGNNNACASRGGAKREGALQMLHVDTG